MSLTTLIVKDYLTGLGKGIKAFLHGDSSLSPLHGVIDEAGAQVSPATEDTLGSILLANQPRDLFCDHVIATTSVAQIVATRTGRQSVTMVNHGTVDVWVGPSGVTSGTGILLPGTRGAAITIESSAAIFAVTSSGSQTISFMEIY
jgi:hypothetical protein